MPARRAPAGRDVDRVYLDGVRRRTTALLGLTVDAAAVTQSADLEYFIQRAAPLLLTELERAASLRRTL